MKFGGSSLASAEAIRQVLSIVRSEIPNKPVIVASAMGDTTDFLLELINAARRGDKQATSKLQDALRLHHNGASQRLFSGDGLSTVSRYIRETFRDLDTRMSKLCRAECTFTPELKDWTLSLGEQLSSFLLAAALEEHCGAAVHVDARRLIVTDDSFNNAQPHYWETYSRIRGCSAIVSGQKTAVLGGFIGSTEDGRTTTLGRGGSDLTASIVGAAINADEIQVWKDVDGMLTCDPRLLPGGYPVKTLSYEEATILAQNGATILHPETMGPAKRLRIPIVVRNTFRPEGEGTRIEETPTRPSNLVKSVAVRNNVTLLEVRSTNKTDDLDALLSFCQQHSKVATIVACSAQTAYIAVQENSRLPDQSLASDRCLTVHVRSEQAILTLVGQIRDRGALFEKLGSALKGVAAFVIPAQDSPCAIQVAVPKGDLKKCLSSIHRAVFSRPASFDSAGSPSAQAKNGKQQNAYASPSVLATA